MKALGDNSVDSIVTDPPYGISFMAKKWDYDVPSVKVWKEAMRVLKPGGHALIACGTRTQHRMVCNIEDAGFEIRDVVSWIYGSGFPKSLNVSKAIDKAAGAERERTECATFGGSFSDDGGTTYGTRINDTPATEAAKQWDGWGTALKPACEFFTLCRKPLSESTVAKNVLKWGTGGINIDGCRVGTEEITISHKKGNSFSQSYKAEGKKAEHSHYSKVQGRFPANLIHDGSQEVLDLFPETKPSKGNCSDLVGSLTERERIQKYKISAMLHTENGGVYVTDQSGNGHHVLVQETQVNNKPSGNKGSAARFFYCPKASKKDRDEGLEGFEDKESAGMAGNMVDGQRLAGDGTPIKTPIRKNNHPTVKPTALMAYLCRLITPTGGVVLDPYMGSGSTGKAAVREGFSFVGIELDPDYYKICKARIIK